MTARVAITGLGAISSVGRNVGEHLQSFKAGSVGIGETRNVPTETLKVKISAEIPGFRPEDHFDPKQLGLMDRASQIAVVAAREAMEGAGEGVKDGDPHRIGCIFAAAVGYQTLEEGYQRLFIQGAPRPHPFTVPRIMPNAAVSHVTMDQKINGPGFSVGSACSSAAHAIGLAFHMVRSGMADVMVAGGSEAALTLGVMKSWEALRVLSPDGCRPFSRDRNGLVLGEGAGVLVLENLDRAKARGATIHAEMVGFGMTSDGLDMTAPDATSAAKAISFALADGGIDPSEVGYVNAHGTATLLNDRTEAAALRNVFDNRLAAIPVSSTKSMYGHCLSAAGAVDMIATTLAVREGFLPPTMNYREPDPDCDFDCVPNASRAGAIDVALSNSFAFGGLNAVLAARRYIA